jgi:hypothetical protein
VSRRYGEPVQVGRTDGAPERFLWRGRLYLVRAVLEHWMEAGSWWQRMAVPVGLVGTAPDSGDEREYWRVEAAAERRAASGIYDLCFDWLSGDWTVAHAHD